MGISPVCLIILNISINLLNTSDECSCLVLATYDY